MNEPTLFPSQAVATRQQETALEKTNGHTAAAGISPAAYDYDGDTDKGLHIWDYLRIIRKHLWLIAGISVLIPTLVAVYVIRKPDVYEAQARIQVDLEGGNSLLGGVSKSGPVI